MSPEITPALDLAKKVSQPYPNDSPAYRAARTALLAEEIELRRHLERVAEMRRGLPLGGEAKDYKFLDECEHQISLKDLFGTHPTLITYFWMFGPERKEACPMCTSFLGSVDIPVRDLTQRVAFAVIGRSPVQRQKEFARERGWTNLKFFQAVGDDFARDYRGLSPEGEEWPALDVWRLHEGRVHHFYGAEMGGTQDPGQDPRGAPDIAPLWNLLDLTPEGRGKDWYPKLKY